MPFTTLMPVLIIFCCVLTLAYAALLLLYRYGWMHQPVAARANGHTPVTCVSVIIPARNEAANIVACVQSVLSQDYPAELLEIIVMDDHSTDGTAALVKSFNREHVRCISLSELMTAGEHIIAYKKKALSAGIAHSKGSLIVTTDADCIAPPQWLSQVVAIYETERPVMVIAPVDFTSDGSIVAVFQSIDFMTMQGITAAAHYLKAGNMSNGANLAFSRQAFDEVGGYQGIDHLASGDDYLLLMKLQQRFPDKIVYLKSAGAIVRTAPQPDWRSFLQQRVRWASKSGKYDDRRMTAILLLVYLFNLSFAVLLLYGFFQPVSWWLLTGMFAVKVLTELYFLVPVATFFGKRQQLYVFPLLQPLHIAYIILAGFLGFFGSYSWKGRKVK